MPFHFQFTHVFSQLSSLGKQHAGRKDVKTGDSSAKTSAINRLKNKLQRCFVFVKTRSCWLVRTHRSL